MKRLLVLLALFMLSLIIGGSGPPDGFDIFGNFFSTGTATYSDASGSGLGTGVANSQGFTTDCHIFAFKPDSTGLDVSGEGVQVCVGSDYWMRTVVKLQKRKNLFWWETLATEDTGFQFEDGLHREEPYATCVSGTHTYRTRTEGSLLTVNGSFTDSANSPNYTTSC